jgi:hypothetical protein
VYAGKWRYSLPNTTPAVTSLAPQSPGVSTLTYHGADVYRGTVLNGRPHGRGSMTWHNGDSYQAREHVFDRA